MVFKHFRIVCTLRVVFLGATIFFLFYLISTTSLYAMDFIAGCLILYQVISLINYVEKTNRDLNRFLEAIKYEDFSQSFSGANLGSSFNELKAAFSDVLKRFQQTRAEKEEHFRYLQTVVEHIGIGLLSFQQDGTVELINRSAKRLLKIVRLKNIKSLELFSKQLVNVLLSLKSGEKALVKVKYKNELMQLAVYATEFRLREQKFILVSIQNIQSELEEREMEAWQNLIRVLTHEIMNSITPIASLASTVNDILMANKADEKAGGWRIDAETIEDISGAVQTIQKRSEGLLHFVESYRKLTRIPKPNFRIFCISELFQRVQQLLSTQIENKRIDFQTSIEPDRLELIADSEQIEQVLINLLLNAIQSVELHSEGTIELIAGIGLRGRVMIQVKDNGPGISEDILVNIFIPFFTTKQEGSGIGLSISRQIMRLHSGTISVQSKPDIETAFTLKF